MPRTSPYRADERLDDWVPDPAVRTHHRRERGGAARGAVGRGPRRPPLRHPPARAARALADPRRRARPDLRRAVPHRAVHAARRGRHLVGVRACAGGSGRSQRDYPRLSGPDDFRAWDERGTVRVLFAHWAEPGEDGALDAGLRGAGRSGRCRRRGCG